MKIKDFIKTLEGLPQESEIKCHSTEYIGYGETILIGEPVVLANGEGFSIISNKSIIP